MTTTPPVSKSNIPVRRLILLGLIILMWAIYANILHAPFVYDDKIEVVGNRTIRFWSEWREILLYNPARALLQLSYAYNFSTSQFDPFDYHVTNLLIHSCTLITVFFASEQLARLGKLTSPIAFATILTAWWGLHPMAVESVTYITGRSESMCALFAFGSIGLKAVHLQQRQWFWNIGAWICILLAIMVKEVAVMLPLLFFAMEWIFENKRSISTTLMMGIGGLLFAGLRGFVVWRSLENPSLWSAVEGFIPQEVERPLAVQLLTQAEVWIRYGGLWVAPIEQTLFHHLEDANLQDATTYLWTLGWLGLLTGGWWISRRHTILRFALVGGILILLPSSSFAALQENMAEHRSHQMGWYLGLFGLTLLWQYRTHNVLRILAPLTLILLSWKTFERNTIWTSEVLLWQEATLVNPESPKAWYGLGDAHRFARQFEPSLAAFATCTRLDVQDMDCWNNMGIVYAEMSNVDKARETWTSALQHNSAYCKAHSNLGFLSYRQEDWDDALVEFRSALVYCPTNVIAHYGLGLLYYGPRLDVQKAIHHLDKVLQINPTFDYASDARQKLLDLTW